MQCHEQIEQLKTKIEEMQGKSKLADKASFEIQRLKDQINEEVRKQESF